MRAAPAPFAVAWLEQPVQNPADLYDSDFVNGFVIRGLTWTHTLLLFCGMALPALVGAWLAVAPCMESIEIDFDH